MLTYYDIENMKETKGLVAKMAPIVNSLIKCYAGDFGYDVEILYQGARFNRDFYWSVRPTGTHFAWDQFEVSSVEYDAQNESESYIFRGVCQSSPLEGKVLQGILELVAFPVALPWDPQALVLSFANQRIRWWDRA